MFPQNRLGNMELSKEVHGLLERIKKLSQQAQRNENYSNTPINISLSLSQKNLDLSGNRNDAEVTFNQEDIISVENMDFTDNERWLYVPENSMENPYTGDLNEWLRHDFISQELETKFEPRKFIDTRTFTRPKKRISRPSLEQFTDGYFSQSSSKSDSLHTHDSKSSLNIFSNDLSTDFNQENIGPVHFNLSEPVYNSSFETILANATENIDSFQNMSPPSLINSLCSSTFTTLMDSSYMNQDIVPNDKENLVENSDPNITYIAGNKSLNETFNVKKDDQLNNTYSKTNTYTRKTKVGNITNSFKASCPDINRTFQRTRDCNLDLTFQKLSDSQPDLTEDLKRTILNQSIELMLPSSETYHSARSGSADSLDERSSSISNSSKDSGSKILNMGDLDTLAKVQEQKLQQAMSTPNKPKTRLLLLEGEVLSPIQNCSDEYLSDSDMSDSCVTARSRFSKHNSPTRAVLPLKPERPEVNFARSQNSKPEVGLQLRTLPTMIVKPMEINRKNVELNRPHTAQIPVVNRPKIRASGLPRPTLATGIPRPTSRIPAPKSIRPSSSRPHQRQPSRTDWMDGCY